ncbi:hypothetical protein GCM10022273_11350 [Cellulomonas soli]
MVTPMSPDSAIADVMLQTVLPLASHWQLDVWTPTEGELRPCPVPVHRFEDTHPEVVAALERYDVVVHVLGDSPLHTRILPLAIAVPGLVVLHDASITNLVRHTAIDRGFLAELVRGVRAEHGPGAAEVLRTGAPEDRPGGWMQFCADVPLDGTVLERSLGAVVHSDWHARRVDGRSLGDVTVARLPVPTNRTHTPARDEASALLDTLKADDVLVVTVGSVNANRHIDEMLEATAGDELLARRVRLWAIGAAEDDEAARLRATADRLGLSDRFDITGRVTDGVLAALLDRAHVGFALRDPVLEGQSASVLTQMEAGLPVVVYDHAHYSELPADAVVKVDPATGARGVAAALRRLVDEPDLRARLGARARAHVLEERTPEAYADALREAASLAMAARPLLHVTSDVAARLARLDLDTVPAVVDSVMDVLFELYDLA